MKYSFNLGNVSVADQVKIESLKIDLEMSVEEMTAQYSFVTALFTAIKDGVKEVAPIIDNIEEKRRSLRHSYEMERIQAEQEKAKAAHSEWRERFKAENTADSK